MAFTGWPLGTYSWWITPLLSKNKIEIVFTLDFWNQNSLQGGVFEPHHLELCFQIIRKTPALVTSNYKVPKVWVTFDRFNKIVSVIKHCCSCSAVNAWGTNCAQFPFLLIFIKNLFYDNFWYSCLFCYDSTRRLMIFL